MKYQIRILIILINLFLEASSINLTQNCLDSEWTLKHVFNDTEYHSIKADNYYLIVFDDFTQLTNTNCTQKTTYKYKTFELKLFAQTSLLFENTFDLKDILNLFKFKTVKPNIRLVNIRGFNQNRDESLTYSNTEVQMDSYFFIFGNTNFHFYLDKSQISREMCV